MKIFISYARKDAFDFAVNLHKKLNQVSDVQAWMDTSLEYGKRWTHQLQTQIRLADVVIILVSEDVCRPETDEQSGSFVENEYKYAKDNKKRIIPALIMPIPIPPIWLNVDHSIMYHKDPKSGWNELLSKIERSNTVAFDDSLVPVKSESSRDQPKMSSNQQLNPDVANVLETVSDLPQQTLATYAWLWRFEYWLKQMVYLEFKTAYGESWNNFLKPTKFNLSTDDVKQFMSSPPLEPVSHASISDLSAIISQHWTLFAPYFPRKNKWDTALEDIIAIHNEVVSFRAGHPDNLSRIKHHLKELDRGFFKFCSSYNVWSDLQTDDPLMEVAKSFASINSPYPPNESHWRYGDITIRKERVEVDINVQNRLWQNRPASESSEGTNCVYGAFFVASGIWAFDAKQFLENSYPLHSQVIHINFKDPYPKLIQITIPAAISKETIVDLLLKFLLVASESVTPFIIEEGDYEKTAHRYWKRLVPIIRQWPEYVLDPENLLSFLTPDMNGSFFGA